MASSLLPTIQQALCGTLGPATVHNMTALANETLSATIIQPALPGDFSSLLTLLFSFSALRDWLKLIVIGGVFESCRRLATTAYRRFIDSFFITATFDQGDDSYDWMMIWLSKQPSWAEARDLQISTKSFGLNSSAVLVPGEEEDASSLIRGTRKLAFLPSISTTQSMWYKRRWMTITRSQESTGYYNRPEDKLSIRIMTRHHVRLNSLLLEAKTEYMAAQEHSISIYVSDSTNDWRHVASRPKRPLRSIVLDPGIKDLLIDDARDFLASKTWYSARGIPFRRGYLLYGAPGSGKTSIIHSLAGELGLDVYIISLSRAGMDDTALSSLISDLPEKCIALMEDIDAAFTQSLNRDAPTPHSSGSSSSSPDGSPDSPRAHEPARTSSRVSLSGLLNALDGVGAQEGRILFATTNKYTSLDPALCRPGRMDIHLEFRLASKYQARELYRCFYLPEDEDNEDEKEDDKESVDSGYSSADNAKLIDLETSSEASVSSGSSSPVSEKVAVVGRSHRDRAPKLSRSKVSQLAEEFADAIPERQFSMAGLQGYLMAYKTRPFEAVRAVTTWIEKEGRQRSTIVAALET
ncbi:putative mitochondrial chaperone BCS1-B [Hypsizygus marmoreus]|uniref:Mitochondrial chaperone BCS1-B n=1 Tax=Hypsizygus marmoreus TaxID=39966 RepID=A0A369JVP9_HYPMA|nr:putative mitochondrial chaperone BCS1-B [Hypsizygus marmoreus]